LVVAKREKTEEDAVSKKGETSREMGSEGIASLP
jgi:hypothetical protein